MPKRIKSERGVYYDLSQSPYVHTTPYADTFRFSSAKKLEIYTRDIEGELARLDKLLKRHRLEGYMPDEIVLLLRRSVTRSFYDRVEGKKDE